MSDWKKNYAFSFRKPCINKLSIFNESEQISKELDAAIKEYRQDLSVTYEKINDDSAEIHLPYNSIILLQYFDDLNRFEFRIKGVNKSVFVEIRKDSPKYFLSIGNLTQHRERIEEKSFDEFNKEKIEQMIRLLLHETTKFEN